MIHVWREVQYHIGIKEFLLREQGLVSNRYASLLYMCISLFSSCVLEVGY